MNQYTDPITGKFRKGNIGGGRPKGFSIVTKLKEKIQEIPEGEKESLADKLIKKYCDEALKGNDKILRDLIDRIDGKAIQRLAGEEGPLEFLVRNLKDGDNSAV